MPPAKTPEVILKQLRRLDGNKVCPNCGKYNEFGFGSVCVKFKTFVCDLCKTSHQAISHRCKSLTMSTWTMEEANELSDEMGGGNDAARHTWLSNAPNCGSRYAGGSRPKDGDRIEVYKKFIEDCYERSMFKTSSPYEPKSKSIQQSKSQTDIPSQNAASISNSSPLSQQTKTVSLGSAPISKPIFETSLIDFEDAVDSSVSSMNTMSITGPAADFGSFQSASAKNTEAHKPSNNFDHSWSEFVQAPTAAGSSSGDTANLWTDFVEAPSSSPSIIVNSSPAASVGTYDPFGLSSFSQSAPASISHSPNLSGTSTPVASTSFSQQVNNHSGSSGANTPTSVSISATEKNAKAMASVLDILNQSTSQSPSILPNALSRPMSANNISNMFGDAPLVPPVPKYNQSPMRSQTGLVHPMMLSSGQQGPPASQYSAAVIGSGSIHGHMGIAYGGPAGASPVQSAVPVLPPAGYGGQGMMSSMPPMQQQHQSLYPMNQIPIPLQQSMQNNGMYSNVNNPSYPPVSSLSNQYMGNNYPPAVQQQQGMNYYNNNVTTNLNNSSHSSHSQSPNQTQRQPQQQGMNNSQSGVDQFSFVQNMIGTNSK